jgi:holliday junction DNA helicase RuvA
MIASVRGEVLVRRPDHVVIESGGVGYRLAVSAETLKAVPARGKQATLHAHLVARDDSLQLYGFASEEERDLFLHLISVSGVGPKVAIAVLSGGTPRELLRAIAAGDGKRFQAVPGVGKRTAERVIVELREKVTGELEEGVQALADGEKADSRTLARDGLMHLGYTITEAEKLLADAEGDSPEEMISAALRRGAKEAA